MLTNLISGICIFGRDVNKVVRKEVFLDTKEFFNVTGEWKVYDAADFHAVFRVCLDEVVCVFEDTLGDMRLNVARGFVSLILYHYVLLRVY